MLSPFPIQTEFIFTPFGPVETTSLVCLRKIGSMDTARVVVNLDPDEASKYLSAGSPLRIRWRGDKKADEFIGYIHSFKPVGQGYLPKTVVVAVSAAYPLFNESARTFYQASIHNVAEEIADDYQFQLDTDPHPLIQSQILQQDESEWALLRRLGDEWGYVLVLDGVRLIFRPLQAVLEENARLATTVISPHGPDTPSVLKEFEPSFSATTKGDPMADLQGAGIAPYGAAPIPWQEVSGGIFKKTTTTRSVTSELEGELVAAAATSRFPFTATATFMYPAGAKPLDVYRISQGGDTRTWTIHSVKHIIDGSGYTGEMVLGSDGQDTAKDARPGTVDVNLRLRRNQQVPAVPTISSNTPYFVGRGANVVNDGQRWRATVAGRRQVG